MLSAVALRMRLAFAPTPRSVAHALPLLRARRDKFDKRRRSGGISVKAASSRAQHDGRRVTRDPVIGATPRRRDRRGNHQRSMSPLRRDRPDRSRRVAKGSGGGTGGFGSRAKVSFDERRGATDRTCRAGSERARVKRRRATLSV